MPIIEMFTNRAAPGSESSPDSASVRNAEETAGDEIALLRHQVMDLRATVLEQEESILFLRDLLAQQWFDAAS